MQEMFILYFLRRVTICPSKNFFPKREKKLSGIKRILKFIYLKRDQIWASKSEMMNNKKNLFICDNRKKYLKTFSSTVHAN